MGFNSAFKGLKYLLYRVEGCGMAGLFPDAIRVWPLPTYLLNYSMVQSPS